MDKIKKDNILSKDNEDKLVEAISKPIPLEDSLTDADVNAVSTTDIEKKVSEIERTGNIRLFLKPMQEKLQKVEAILAKANAAKKKYEDDLLELEIQKEDFEAHVKNEKSKIEEDKKAIEDDKAFIREKNTELKVREVDLNNNNLAGVLSHLLDSLDETEKEITKHTEQIITELAAKHKQYIDSLKEVELKKVEVEKASIANETLLASQKESYRKEVKEELANEKNQFENYKESEKKKIEEQSKKLKEQESQLEKDRRIFEASKPLIVENEVAEIKEKLEEALEIANYEKDLLAMKNKSLVAEIDRNKQFRARVMSAFSSMESDEMLSEQEALRLKCDSLEKELDSCYTEEQYQQKCKEIELYEKSNNELKEKLDMQRLAELQAKLSNEDKYILEVNSLKALLDGADAREHSLKNTIEDLRETISLLKSDVEEKENTFEYAHKMDNDNELLNRKLRDQNPRDLCEMVYYLQQRMYSRDVDNQFIYNINLIRKFIAGLHMSPLSILWGISGTGKTSLPIQIAMAMTAGDLNYTTPDSEEKVEGDLAEPYRICAVQSGWRDNMDLMGFYNNFEKRYKETDFFKAIYLAGLPKYKNTLFFIILDEMNLSHPEHYFSDFLSLIEQNEKNRKIRIDAPTNRTPNLVDRKDGRLLLPRNVRFIGTANQDETTVEFAPKTYDRANVIELPPVDSEDAKNIKFTNKKYTISYSWLKERFKEADETFGDACKAFNAFINNEELKSDLALMGIGIGERFKSQSSKFISVYMATGTNDKKSLAEATDFLITSKLFRYLKNNYTIKGKSLELFLDNYVNKYFVPAFGYKPEEAIKLIELECKRK